MPIWKRFASLAGGALFGLIVLLQGGLTYGAAVARQYSRSGRGSCHER